MTTPKGMTRNIDLANADLKDLTAWFNENSSSRPRKFSDIDAARTQATELYSAIVDLQSGTSKGKSKKAPAAPKAEKKAAAAPKAEKKAAAAKPEKKAKGTVTPANGEKTPALPGEPKENKMRGKVGKFSGFRILRSTENGANPRREGTHGHRSFELIDPKKGVTYEDYVAAGGRNNDLNWDYDHGWVKLEAIKGAKA